MEDYARTFKISIVDCICPRCQAATTETLVKGEVCTFCLDELEFGYPSFPSYPLSESSKLKLIK